MQNEFQKFILNLEKSWFESLIHHHLPSSSKCHLEDKSRTLKGTLKT